MKGVILAGGTGTRLGKLTRITNKHLLPIYDRPMIEYPLETLIKAGITKIMIVTDKSRAGEFLNYLGSGAEFGVRIFYGLQDSASGIADALSVARDFVQNDIFTVILGDNVVFGEIPQLKFPLKGKARIFLKKVEDGYRFGIARIDERGFLVDIIEKPADARESYAVTGIYQYDCKVFDLIDDLNPSKRGEFEITDVNRQLLRQNSLDYEFLENDWIDSGTFDSLLKAQLVAKKHRKNAV